MSAPRYIQTGVWPGTAECKVQVGFSLSPQRLRRRTVSLILLPLICLLLCPVYDASGQDNPLRIAGIQAKLFFEGTGAFSEDVLADPHYVLWNTSVGEGSAGAPSHSTLVLVEIAGGAAGTSEHGRRISFTANYKYGFVNPRGTVERRSVQVKQTAAIGYFGKDGKSYVGFWLYDTGCTPVDLTAQIVGQTPAPVVNKTIGFKCGE
jgi:hypothetical protein